MFLQFIWKDTVTGSDPFTVRVYFDFEKYACWVNIFVLYSAHNVCILCVRSLVPIIAPFVSVQ
jgi:hypothetical protein